MLRTPLSWILKVDRRRAAKYQRNRRRNGSGIHHKLSAIHSVG